MKVNKTILYYVDDIISTKKARQVAIDLKGEHYREYKRHLGIEQEHTRNVNKLLDELQKLREK